MKLGMYTREIKRESMDALFHEINRLGFETVQLDLFSIPEISEELPLGINPEVLSALIQTIRNYGISVAAVNGTFNMCVRSDNELEDALARFEVLAQTSKALGCGLITLCTGSRNEGYPLRWRYHPENHLPEAWEAVLLSGRRVARVAQEYGIRLGIEIESTLVVNTPEKALRFFDELGSAAEAFGVIFDPANIYENGLLTIEYMHSYLDHTLDLMADRIILAHGKDLCYGDGLVQNGCGIGMIDYDYYLEGLKRIGYTDTMIIHGIKREADFPYCCNFMRQKLCLHGLQESRR